MNTARFKMILMCSTDGIHIWIIIWVWILQNLAHVGKFEEIWKKSWWDLLYQALNTCFCLKPFVTNRTPSEGVPTSLNRLRSNSELPCSLGALTTEETKGDGFRPSSEARAFGTRGGQQTCFAGGDSCWYPWFRSCGIASQHYFSAPFAR